MPQVAVPFWHWQSCPEGLRAFLASMEGASKTINDGPLHIRSSSRSPLSFLGRTIGV